MKAILFICFFLIILSKSSCQEKELIQYSGKIFNEYLQALPFVNITIPQSNRGTISDNEGKFSFIVTANDTLEFSFVGYKKTFVIIPDSLETIYYNRDVIMQADTFMFTEVEVYRWKDYEAFQEAFLNLELPESDLDRAKKNIKIIKNHISIENNLSAKANHNLMMEQHRSESFNRGTMPTYEIFNIVAWTKFIEAIKNGDFKQKK